MIARLAESFEFVVSSARCRLGASKEDINRIEREVSDFIISKKLELENLAPICRVETKKEIKCLKSI